MHRWDTVVGPARVTVQDALFVATSESEDGFYVRAGLPMNPEGVSAIVRLPEKSQPRAGSLDGQEGPGSGLVITVSINSSSTLGHYNLSFHVKALEEDNWEGSKGGEQLTSMAAELRPAYSRPGGREWQHDSGLTGQGII